MTDFSAEHGLEREVAENLNLANTVDRAEQKLMRNIFMVKARKPSDRKKHEA